LKFPATEPAFFRNSQESIRSFFKIPSNGTGFFPEFSGIDPIFFKNFPAHDPFPTIIPGIPFYRTSILPSEIRVRITEIRNGRAASRISGPESPFSGRNPAA
jgi:hypothetical protein